MRKRKRKETVKTNNKRTKVLLTNKLEIVNHLCEIIHEKYNNSSSFITRLEGFEKSIKEGIHFKDLLELFIMKFKNKEIENVDELKEKILEKITNTITSEVDTFLENSIKFEKENSDPISKELMKDPVTLRATGHVFDRLQIMQCLEYRKKCPITNVDLEEKDDIVDYFIGNFVVKGLIETYKVNFVKKAAGLLEAIKKIRSTDQDLIKKGLTIIDMFKNFDLKEEKLVEYKLHDSEEEIIVSHEVLLSLTNCELSAMIKARLDLAKFYIKREELREAEKVIELKILKEDINSTQKEDGLFCIIEILEQYDRNSRRHKTKLKKYVSEFIQCCGSNKNYERGEKMFLKYNEFFQDETVVETLLVKASINRDNISKSGLYFKVASHFYDEEEYEIAKRYCKLSVLSNNENLESHKMLLDIYDIVGNVGEEIQKCLDLFEMYNQGHIKLHYIERAYNIDNTNEAVLRKYLKYCIDIEDKIKFEELLEKSDVTTKLLFNEILEMKQNIKGNRNMMRRLAKKNKIDKRKIKNLEAENKETKLVCNYKTIVIPISENEIREIYNDNHRSFNHKILFNELYFTFSVMWNGSEVFYIVVNNQNQKFLVKLFIKIGNKGHILFHKVSDPRTACGSKVFRNYQEASESFVMYTDRWKKIP